MWREILVSHSRITMTSDIKQLENPTIPAGAIANFYCPSSCLRMGWCKIWCSHPSTNPTHCILANSIVMPKYIELNTADAITCYTAGEVQDLATNVLIAAAGAQAPWFPNKRKENLVDGIYNYQEDDHFSTATAFAENWFLIDFTENVMISQVLLFAPNNQFADKLFYDLEVRVGNVTVTSKAELAAYDLFGAFPGQAYPGQVVDLKSAESVSCRFLGVQKMTQDWFEFEVAHIEVY
ncbi:hypothetical protein Pcinc_009484 [Petrolisthes cinctipes]|uniref:Uncharacterized protein n=1 Tax=Petrolisthes cinctipes TaxID=88211 RepID=A0AAE1G7D0_PETCI|nr:hypothetical protein Pcinc_009484 [Petrolisthes cinctipes]